ncbi:3-carboxy-cis,cis-muconate cycloisomerase [Piscinibacter koreensis]|uniref:3-carboxy-cis,cis-muconate cycloisomerase n=1 Tax=Piscinibacter koreensis TaxID=2742824 RepID=A0A7Y6TX61_9BURK|nr:3-carboxy-cis,cis-muconate cycloisomerase [Schlegelella koreensis]NUZ06767.1 3-carboxy-cis,cis-muconate cycloisomerase [Schlegelella koreensis]
MSAPLFEGFLASAEMGDVFAAPALVQAMLDFEAALARAEAAEGVIPAAAGNAIAAACRADRIDVDALGGAARSAGSLAIPLVKQLTARVAEVDADAASYVHWGSTSQDVIDTGMVLATRRALALIDADLDALCAHLFELADRHRDAPILGRTLLQPAQVESFGFKLVGWLAPLVRTRARLHASGAAALQLQLGGAIGTLSALGAHGPAIAERMARELGLGVAPGAWHTQRDTWVALACDVGVLCGGLGKIARDLSLLAQGEVGELAEPSGGGRGGSSAMPNKRNPVASMIALAAATRAPQRVAALLAAMPQEHERGLGNWQAELAEWPSLFLSAHGALGALADAIGGLDVATDRMRANIDAQGGQVFAEAVGLLAGRVVGKSKAHAWLEQLSRRAFAERRHLRELVREALAADARLAGAIGAEALDAAFDVDAAARAAGELAARQLAPLRATHAALGASRPFESRGTD